MRQVIDIAFDAAHRSTTALGELIPDLAVVPLAVHARYSREEILAGLGVAARRKPSTFREGVVWCEELNTDAFFITLKKTDTDYSPMTMYRDFALSPELLGIAGDDIGGVTDRAALYSTPRTRLACAAVRPRGEAVRAGYIAVRFSRAGRLHLPRGGEADGGHLAAAARDADGGVHWGVGGGGVRVVA
jgi:hypothetical protein